MRVVELGGLSAAARRLGMTPSAVSKLVARLEERLGVRLLHRSTRKLRLTDEGSFFYERSVTILEEMRAAESTLTEGGAPRGRLRINSNVPFGLQVLLPLIPRFADQHPEITLDIALGDVVVDLFEARADVAIRTGSLRDSRLVARKLGESRMVVVASPDYLARHGTPRTTDELARHRRLAFCFARQSDAWPFRDGTRGVTSIPQGDAVLVSDGEAMRRLALAGAGVARLARFQVAEDLRAGRLRTVLDAIDVGEVQPVHAVYVGEGRRVPARVRAFLDFLVAHVALE
ncbi:HTH-type transcriptional regulator DmlR [Sandaracinus amylolyticus]|nr:HTH-type transcriptional regulator DmlR [Sandaracinus amylolyticus]